MVAVRLVVSLKSDYKPRKAHRRGTAPLAESRTYRIKPHLRTMQSSFPALQNVSVAEERGLNIARSHLRGQIALTGFNLPCRRRVLQNSPHPSTTKQPCPEPAFHVPPRSNEPICPRPKRSAKFLHGSRFRLQACHGIERTAARCIINLLIIHGAPDGHAEDQTGRAGSQRAPGLSLCQDLLFSHRHVVTGHLHVTGQSLLKSQLAHNKVGTKPDSPDPDGPPLPFLSRFFKQKVSCH